MIPFVGIMHLQVATGASVAAPVVDAREMSALVELTHVEDWSSNLYMGW
jgi:hypothetical protein